MIKRFVHFPLALAVLALSSFGQQSIDQSAPHVKDNASFGNEKAPKKNKNPTSRTVTGQVTDETGQVLQGALVTLTDSTTNDKITFFTKKDGRYQFENLSFNSDYQVQAIFKDKTSEPRKLSQYDHTARPVRILEINTENPPVSTTAAAKNR